MHLWADIQARFIFQLESSNRLTLETNYSLITTIQVKITYLQIRYEFLKYNLITCEIELYL